MSLAVRRAGVDDAEAIAPLFDAYRVFYGQRSDRAAARTFLSARLQRDESVILLARHGDDIAGFTQLYPMFSSVALARTWILNDLFVAATCRRAGVARALLGAAAEFARADGALRLELETTPDNAGAQALYRSAGWQDYDGTMRFHLPLAPG
ncbi:GNAT family N-acetyltransferase [Luteimonas vadosa]|uniref:GNAT family N-acetyltransferase n=1 Tax=Luteimonas vadosa TaxID=1165507 RepID=A0ABP9EA57_9GAMM